MRLTFIRHGEPAWTVGGRSVDDPVLTERGQRQAALLAEHLADLACDEVLVSPLVRARETAAPLEHALGRTAEVDDGLAEFDTADSSYVPVEELRAAGDPRWRALVHGDLYSSGVDPVAFRARVVAAVERIAARHPGGRVVLVSHAGAINAAAGAVLAQERTIWFAPDYCSITRIAAARDGRRGIVSLNETGHVRDLLSRG